MGNSVFTGVIQLLVILVAFWMIGSVLLPGPTRRATSRLGGWVIGVVWRLGVALVFTVTDSLITSSLAAYHLATARPWLVPEDWFAFLHRANDRARGVLSHG